MPFSNDVDRDEKAMMETEAVKPDEDDNSNETEASDEEANEDSGDLGVLEICGVKEIRTSKLYQVHKFRDRLFMLLY